MSKRYYIQFYDNSTGYLEGSCPPIFDPKYVKPIEATGDRGIIIVDGRLKYESVVDAACCEGKKRNYIGYRIYRGEGINNMEPLTNFIRFN